ncbi:MAG: ATP synthase F1 subunit delta [Muribaculaceae bacterium]|nr:ATP synthase F1 subunit delta [Muribaculaceae bacterium]
MDNGLIPRRYAKALYMTGLEKGSNEAIYELMQRVDSNFAQHPSLSATVANPFVGESDKVQLLVTAAGESDNALYGDFLKLLSQNGRLDMAWDIARAFVDIYRRQNNIYRVTVVSATTLGTAEKTRIESFVSGHIGKGSVEYEYKVDASLIGGFTITVNSERLDVSVASQLKQLRLQLLG